MLSSVLSHEWHDRSLVILHHFTVQLGTNGNMHMLSYQLLLWKLRMTSSIKRQIAQMFIITLYTYMILENNLPSDSSVYKWHQAKCLESKVPGVNMGPIWGWQDRSGRHVVPLNFSIWVHALQWNHDVRCGTYSYMVGYLIAYLTMK